MSDSLALSCLETVFFFRENEVIALVPDAALLSSGLLPRGKLAAPYWARLWPASMGLCEYLVQRPELVRGKRVLELAAGLGLPGLLAARWAESVILSDLDPDSVRVMQSSVGLNELTNVRCEVIDWGAIPAAIQPEIVLLSDVNYEPEVFETLFRSLSGLLEAGITVILSTPQRLMAKPFIGRLLPFCAEQQEFSIGAEFVSVFLLR